VLTTTYRFLKREEEEEEEKKKERKAYVIITLPRSRIQVYCYRERRVC
jgi:hypothetical protein